MITPLPKTPNVDNSISKSVWDWFIKLGDTVNKVVGWVNSNSSSVIPTGAVMPFAADITPDGWLKCNGQAVSRSTYSYLFAAISTTYGSGDGSTTFNVPDLRGEFIRGWDDGRGIDSGRAIGSYQSDTFKSHTHTLTGVITTGVSNNYVGTNASFGVGGNTGSTGGTETRPRNIALLYCIKY